MTGKNLVTEALSLTQLSNFISSSFPLIVSQVSLVFPWIICDVFIGQRGDVETVTAAGMAYTYMNITYWILILATIEVMGAGAAKAFGAQNYQKMASLFYQCCAMIVLSTLLYLVITSLFCESLLIVVNIIPRVARRAKVFALWLCAGFFIHALNRALQAYLMSQNIIKELNYNTIASVSISLLAGHFFIIRLDMQELGAALSIFIQESLCLCLHLWILFAKGHRETLVRPSLALLASDIKVFVRKNMFSLSGMYGECLFLEVNTVLVTMMKDIDQLAAWLTYAGLMFAANTVAIGISNAFRTRIGQTIGEGNVASARKLSAVYHAYIFLLSLVFAVFVFVFAEQIGFAFIKNDSVVAIVTVSLHIFCTYLYPFLVLNTFFAVFRLLNLDTYFFKMSTIVLPILGLSLSVFFTWGAGIGYQGVVISQSISHIIIVAAFFYKTYWITDWETAIDQDNLKSLLEL